MRYLIATVAIALSTTAFAQRPGKRAAEGQAVTATTASSVLDFTMTSIDGEPVPLSKYKGKVLLIVNVASRCGMTPQYEQLQELHTKYAERGLVVMGFPANEFRGQEPGTNAEIREFCTSKYGVTFPMFAKIVVKDDGASDAPAGRQHELYRFLTSKETNPEHGGDIQWNFTKFLVDRHGKVIGRFEPRTRPDAPEVIAAIEQALGATPG